MEATQRPVRTDFAERLRAQTRADHEEAHTMPFTQALLAGELHADAYAVMLAQYYFAYELLEEASDHMRSDIVAGPFITDRLRRLPALEADLGYYFGPDWRDVTRPSAATEEYRNRLLAVCFDWPGGFVAHHYTRYLADLSGGQIIRKVVSRSLNLPDDGGLAFLTFERIPHRRRFKDAYRTLLDTAGWTATEEERIVAEVRLAYRLNIKVLADLGRRLPPRIPAPRG